MATATPHIRLDLEPFCDPDIMRFNLATPWLSGDWVYATDGAIMIRVRHDLYPSAKEPDGKVPPCDKALEPVAKVTKWKLPPKMRKCEHCRGVGRRLRVCDQCHGVGWLLVNGMLRRCDDSDEHDFDDEEPCYGETAVVIPCTHCGVHFEGRKLRQWYMNLIRSIPDVRMGVASESPEEAVYFRSGEGIVGALMPLSTDGANDL